MDKIQRILHLKVLELLQSQKLVTFIKSLSYLQCTLNLNTNSKNEAFLFNRSPENEGQSWYLSTIWEILIITGLKSDMILSVVDRNGAIFTPYMRHRVKSF